MAASCSSLWQLLPSAGEKASLGADALSALHPGKLVSEHKEAKEPARRGGQRDPTNPCIKVFVTGHRSLECSY